MQAAPRPDASTAPRVAHVATRLCVGGMETVVAHLVRHMPRAEYRSEVWCLEDADTLGLELRSEGIPVQVLGKRGRYDVMLFARIAALLYRRRIAILHCHDELSWFYGAVASTLVPSTRTIMTMHGRRRNISRRHLIEQRMLATRTDAMVCVSQFLVQQLSKELAIPAERLVAVPNGIPHDVLMSDAAARIHARRLLGVSPDDFVVGTVGELSPVKNPTLAIEAAAIAHCSVPRLRLVLIGDGGLRGELEAVTRHRGAADIVRFAGLRRDVRRLLPALDAYLCCSDYEGVSLSILEAMMQGRPIVATAVGGNPEVLRNDAGVLVEPRQPALMAQALVRLAHDPDLRARLGARSRAVATERYGIGRMISDYRRLYATVMTHHRRRPFAQAEAQADDRTLRARPRCERWSVASAPDPFQESTGSRSGGRGSSSAV